jgi:peptidoglycan hydrolase-like protein with peptidoglycan-binding domain
MVNSQRPLQLDRGSFLRIGLGITGLAVLGHGLVLPDAVDAAIDIASCDSWGARPPTRPVEFTTPANKIIIHHSATPNTEDTSRDHAFALAQQIQQDHMGRGFIDTGQHFTVSRGGYVTEGRHRSLEVARTGTRHVIGAHCIGQNSSALGIENEGDYRRQRPPDILTDRLVQLCAYLCSQYRISPSAIFPHSDYYGTECPGDALRALLPAVRARVAARLGSGLPDPLPAGAGGSRRWPVCAEGSRGECVRSVQYLLSAHGLKTDPDSILGRISAANVREFQRRTHGLEVDGVVGPRTWGALVIQVQYGSRGDAVRAVQSQLNTRGAGLDVDGVLGRISERAVRSWQAASGENLVVDGVVGRGSWCVLVGGALH